MKTQFNIETVLTLGKLQNELEYERALIAERKLRILAKANYRLKSVRSKLRSIIQKYENKNWSSDSDISVEHINESDIAELIAEKERVFLKKRKELIKHKLKKYSLTQQALGILLGHKSKTYMSELMNGIVPFTLTDLVVINRLLNINLIDLIPTTLSQNQRTKIKNTLLQIGASQKLKLSQEDFDSILT